MHSPKRKREREKAPLIGCGHSIIFSPVFLHPVRIWGIRAHVPVLFLEVSGPEFKP